MQIFKRLLKRNFDRLHKKGVKLRTIGNIDAFPKSIADGVKKGVEQTKNNTKITAIFALNYGGRDEMLRAVNKAIRKLQTGNRIQETGIGKQNSLISDSSLPITENDFSQLLDTKYFPDPDLIIRTGGEQRLSGFLLWQSEYSEFYFTDTNMPDFDEGALDKALEELSRRQRRFGK